MKIDWDKMWFVNRVIVLELVHMFLILCTVVAAVWGGTLVAMTTNSLFGVMFAVWAVVVGYTGKNTFVDWLSTKMFKEEIEVKKD
jgi:uncharacterized membrane protein YdjX (TVP38/TMEM64 family)